MVFDKDRYSPIETLDIDILSCDSGWLYFKINMGAQENTIHASAVFNIFPDLLSWLEAIVTGERECAFEIDEEGTIKKMHATQHSEHTTLFKLQQYQYDIKEDREYFEDFIVGYVDTCDFVRTLYTAFVDFYHSDRYDRKTHESFYLHRHFESKFGKSNRDDEVMDTLLTFKSKELRYLFLGIAYADVNFLTSSRSLKSQFLETIRVVMLQKTSYKKTFPYWFEGFDVLSPREKIDYLINAFHEDVAQASLVFDLQYFKSKQIETYLLSRSKTDDAHRDTISWDAHRVEQCVTGIPLAHVKINSIDIYDDLFLNIEAFIASTQASGTYPLFVCGCSDEGCGGIFKSPKVSVKDETIVWEIFQPQPLYLRFDKQVLLEKARSVNDD
jgi:hypothetical protein